MEGKWVLQAKPALGLIHIMTPYPPFKSCILGSCTCTLSRPQLVCEWMKCACRKTCLLAWLVGDLDCARYMQEKQHILSAPHTDTLSFIRGLLCPTSFAVLVKKRFSLCTVAFCKASWFPAENQVKLATYFLLKITFLFLLYAEHFSLQFQFDCLNTSVFAYFSHIIYIKSLDCNLYTG